MADSDIYLLKITWLDGMEAEIRCMDYGSRNGELVIERPGAPTRYIPMITIREYSALNLLETGMRHG